MIAIKVDASGLAGINSMLAGLRKQATFAAKNALNNVAFKVNAEIKDEMKRRFQGGATPYTLSAFRVTKATKENLTAIIALRPDSGGKARPYDRTLQHLFNGGPRSFKNMEGAFLKIGALPRGFMMVPPRSDSWANPLDSFGNPSKGLIVRLISYFQAFSQSGFRANSTDKKRAKLAGIASTASGYKTIGGVVYFISYGKGERNGRSQHLPAGIWAKRGIHGSDVAPVFLFVRTGRWSRKIDLDALGSKVVQGMWASEFNRELASAMRTAR